MPRGGARKGTPGKAYSNRTDLSASMKPVAPGQVNPTAAGGITAPAPQDPQQQGPQFAPRSPEDSPMLSAPTQRPNEPITAGLDSGPGPGSDALAINSVGGQMSEDMKTLKQHLPMLREATKYANAPKSFTWLVNYLEQA